MRTANEQKIGDEYASCMDVATVNKLGLTPLKPELDRISALTSKAELPALIAHLHSIGVNAFFGMGSAQDYADSSAVITTYTAGGLGLPERDYYTRSDAKSVEQRQQYVAHVKAMLVLAGEPEAQAAADAEAVMAIETRLAKASLTITEQRDPKNLDHPTDVTKLSSEQSHFSLERLYCCRTCAGVGQNQRNRAEVFCGVQQPGRGYADRSDQSLSALAPSSRLCGY